MRKMVKQACSLLTLHDDDFNIPKVVLPTFTSWFLISQKHTSGSQSGIQELGLYKNTCYLEGA
jgi:hypothetical protein